MPCLTWPRLAALSDWFISPAGQAWAAWTSSFFSIVAIAIALGVFVVETKRSNKALEREAAKDAAAASAVQQREVEARRQAREQVALERHAFITACIDLAVEAQRTASKVRQQHSQSEFVDTLPYGPLPHLLEPLLDQAHALQLAAPAENRLALMLARLTRTLRDFVEYRGLRSTPAGSVFRSWMDEKLADLGEREAGLRNILSGLQQQYPDANLPA
jgi:hypothetical protein